MRPLYNPIFFLRGRVQFAPTSRFNPTFGEYMRLTTYTYLKLIITLLTCSLVLGSFVLGQKIIGLNILTNRNLAWLQPIAWWYSRPIWFRGVVTIIAFSVSIFLLLALYLIIAQMLKRLDWCLIKFGPNVAKKLAEKNLLPLAELVYKSYIDTFMHQTQTLRKAGVFDFIQGTMALANLYCENGRFMDAESLCRLGLKSMREVLGNQHPDLVPALEGYAGVLQLVGQKEEADKVRSQANQISGGS